MLRIAFKYSYVGWEYYGSQYQPDKRTIDGMIFNALEKIGIDAKKAEYKTAGRTDAGVSALGNVFAINLDTFEPWFIKALNSHLPDDIAVWGYKAVDRDFNPRRALSRRYMYVMLDEGLDVDAMKKASKHFLGKHNFENFAKGCSPCFREIYSFDVSMKGNLIVFSVEGNAFAWQMIRRMVSALLQVGRGDADENLILKALRGERIVFEPASPYGLLLVDVKFPFKFEVSPEGLSSLRKMILLLNRKFSQFYGVVSLMSDFLEALSPSHEP